MVNNKGGVSQSSEELKAKAKQDITAPGDYHKMIFQLKAFLTLLEILFGDEKIVVEKIKDFIKLIKKKSI